MKKNSSLYTFSLLKSICVFLIGFLMILISARNALTAYQQKAAEAEKPKPVIENLILVRAYKVDAKKGEQAPITYTLAEPARVRIIVCAKNDPDQLYRILLWDWQEAGPQTVMFDGRDQGGYPLDLGNCSFWISAYEKDHYRPGTIELKPMTTQDLILGKQGPHDHNRCFPDKCKASEVRFAGYQNVLPEPGDEILPIKEDTVFTGVVNIKAHVAKEARGYGDMTGYGVRWMVDQTLVEAQYYERDCDGNFEIQLDTSAFPEGPHVLRVSCCDHYDHVGVYSLRVVFRERR